MKGVIDAFGLGFRRIDLGRPVDGSGSDAPRGGGRLIVGLVLDFRFHRREAPGFDPGAHCGTQDQGRGCATAPSCLIHGQGLQLTGGEQGLGQQRNVIVGGLAEAKVLRGDIEITEMDQRAVTGRGDLERCGDDGDGGGTGHEGSPAAGEVHPRLYGARPRPSFPAF